jgi:hypothetical protein
MISASEWLGGKSCAYFQIIVIKTTTVTQCERVIRTLAKTGIEMIVFGPVFVYSCRLEPFSGLPIFRFHYFRARDITKLA